MRLKLNFGHADECIVHRLENIHHGFLKAMKMLTVERSILQVGSLNIRQCVLKTPCSLIAPQSIS